MKSSPEADKDTSFLLTKIIRNKKIKKAIFRAIRKDKGVSSQCYDFSFVMVEEKLDLSESFVLNGLNLWIIRNTCRFKN